MREELIIESDKNFRIATDENGLISDSLSAHFADSVLFITVFSRVGITKNEAHRLGEWLICKANEMEPR